jgi:integrase
MKKALTDRTVQSMKVPAAGQLDVFDRGYPGLALRLSYAGSRSFVIFHTREGKTKRITLGLYPAMTLAEARDAWREIRNGRGLPMVAPTLLFESVFEEWLKRDQAENRSAAAVEARMRHHVLPYWKGRDIASINRPDVITIMDRIADSGAATMARRVHALIHRLFVWAINRGIVEKNPAAGIERGKEVRRDRVLTDAELVKVWKCDAGHPFTQAVKLLILTGARRSEIGDLRWDEIDGDTIALPGSRTKNGEPNRIPLSAPAREILAAMPRFSDYVFTISGNRPATGWEGAKKKLDTSCGATDWRFHDLRRTASTGMNEIGAEPHIVEAILGHTVKGVAGTYNKAKHEAAKRAALEAWGAHVMGLVASTDVRR